MPDENTIPRIITGYVVHAEYSQSKELTYQHNLLIEALPPILTSYRVASLMRREPAYHSSERLLPPEDRLIAVQRIANYIDPTWVFLDLEQRFARIIRNGYLARNPLSAEWRKQIMSGFPTIDLGEDIPGYAPKLRSTAAGLAILGASGVGKSTAVESVLSLYPQVIIHTKYNASPIDQNQLVWLKLDCPFDGSIRGLCLMFFQVIDQILGTRYYQKYCNKRRTVDELLPLITNTAAVIGLGVLVIDEIQRLSRAKSGGAGEMLDFFVQLVNTIGVPVVLVGTYKAYDLLAGEFAQARRSAGQGDLIWPLLKLDDDWRFFLRGLWRYQWTATPTELTEEIIQTLHTESQGITDIAVKLYMLAQWAIIGDSNELLSPELFEIVAKDSLKLARPMLEALRTNNIEILKKIPDLQSPLANPESYYQEAAKRVHTKPLNPAKELGSRAQDIFRQIVTQLSLAGVEQAEAELFARKVLGNYGEKTELKQLIAAAFQLALPTKTPAVASTPSRQQKKKKTAIADGDLRTFAGKDAETHTALRDAGLVRSAAEFLD